MSEEQQIEVKRKKVDEESFSAGRLLGVVARRDPELYERLKIYAEQQGMKPTEIVYDALQLYDEFLTLSAVDAKSLVAALKLLDHLFKRLMQMMLTLNQFFTSEFFTQQIEIMHNIRQQQMQELAKQQAEEKKSKKQELKEQIMMSVMNMFMGLLTNMMTNMFKLQGAQAPQVQLPQMQPSSSLNIGKPKIVKGSK